jgi:hypothetical protein
MVMTALFISAKMDEQLRSLSDFATIFYFVFKVEGLLWN